LCQEEVSAVVAWELEIHHIDVRGTGDATLIIAQEVAPLAGLVARVRSVLIDGGRQNQWLDLHNYLVARLGALGTLNVIVVTHYQDDHVQGIIWLLKHDHDLYNRVRIYDQGWPAGDAATEQNYMNYVRAINGLNANGPVFGDNAHIQNRARVTRLVRSDDADPDTMNITRIGLPAVPPIPVGTAGTDQARHAAVTGQMTGNASWLLTGGPAEVLWDDGLGAVAPQGAPTVRFVAANKYVRTATGITAIIHGTGVDTKNEKSLGVEVSFGSFRYYVAGDIETAQEDRIMALLNAGNDANGRVVAMKTSHHGSATATSRAFVDRLRPAAAFVSCGTGNTYPHPSLATVNALEGYPADDTVYVDFPIPPNRPISYYLTGYGDPNAIGGPESVARVAGYTAGNPYRPGAIPRAGHIVVRVSEAQSARDVRGATFRGVATAALLAATSPGVPNAMGADAAMAAATAAANAALSSGAGPAARAFLISAGNAVAAAAAAAEVASAIDHQYAAPLTGQAVALAAMGAGAAAGPAAGAGAAASAFIGGCSPQAVQAAVEWTLIGAGDFVQANAVGIAAGAEVANLDLFTVTFWNRDRPGGAGNHVITH
jgi:beta-lactamase superfamily II metal-dependent hydrolase